jgi:hypothetical protein
LSKGEIPTGEDAVLGNAVRVDEKVPLLCRTDRGIDFCAAYLGKLDTSLANPAGGCMDQNGFAALDVCDAV